MANAVLYLNRTDCQWRYVPADLPNWNTVRHYCDRFRADGTWELIHDTLQGDCRVTAGKEPTPSAGVMDSRSVKTAGEKGGCWAQSRPS